MIFLGGINGYIIKISLPSMETKNYQAGMEKIYAMSRGPKDQILISTATGIYMATYDAKLDVFESRLRRISDL